jgi:hypothetical protein
MNILKRLFGSKPSLGREKPKASTDDREERNEAEVERLVGELIRIGKDVSAIRSYGSSERQKVGASGFVRPPEQGRVDERARAIGKRLYMIGGQDLMLKAHQQVTNELGPEIGRELSVCWNGVGYWTHKAEHLQRPKEAARSENLRALEERLASDPEFARVTAQRNGENLLRWTPQLTTEERRAATAIAAALFASARVSGGGAQEFPVTQSQEGSESPTISASEKGKRLEKEVEEELDGLFYRFSSLVSVKSHPAVTLQSGETIFPDFDFTVRLSFAKLHYFIECQDREKKSKDILHKISYVRDKQRRNTFMVIYRDGACGETPDALKREGVMVLSLQEFRQFVRRMASTLETTNRDPDPGIPDQGMLGSR